VGNVLVVAGAVLILCGLAVVIIEVRRGEPGFGQLRGESAETRREVRRAIREGGTDDPRIDQLARRALRATSKVRRARYFFMALLAFSILLLIVGPDTPAQILLRSSHVALWTSAIGLSVVNQRRLDNYRGLRPTVGHPPR
jgi:hypothetical protein